MQRRKVLPPDSLKDRFAARQPCSAGTRAGAMAHVDSSSAVTFRLIEPANLSEHFLTVPVLLIGCQLAP